jgi:chondroitin 4-sulfotransferase 11
MVDTLEYFLPIDNINFIGRFENLTSDFEKLKNKLQLKTNIKHHHKTTFRKKYTEYYNTNTYDLVTELYADDIKKFNYSYDC